MEKKEESRIFVTHYINREPNKNGWIKLFFITRKDCDEAHYLGFEFNSPIPNEVIRKNEERQYYIQATPIVEISLSQSVWMNEKSEIWVADRENPFNGKRERVFSLFSEFASAVSMLSACLENRAKNRQKINKNSKKGGYGTNPAA